jgi:hypothetical protein
VRRAVGDLARTPFAAFGDGFVLNGAARLRVRVEARQVGNRRPTNLMAPQARVDHGRHRTAGYDPRRAGTTTA